MLYDKHRLLLIIEVAPVVDFWDTRAAFQTEHQADLPSCVFPSHFVKMLPDKFIVKVLVLGNVYTLEKSMVAPNLFFGGVIVFIFSIEK